jgi:hypothetical protein
MFKLGDTVELSEDFEGSITVSGWSRNSIEDCVFKVVSREVFGKKHPKFAKVVKSKPITGQIFLKYNNEVFVLYPSSSLSLVKAAEICNCSIARLWAGNGHLEGCPEE